MFLKYCCELNIDCMHFLAETVENGNESADFKKKLRYILDCLGVPIPSQIGLCSVELVIWLAS
jgi:hypothetical protein